MQAATSPAYQQGYLLYLRETNLIAQPFDGKRLEIVGDAYALAEQVQSFSASQTGGVLAYWTGARANAPQLAWFDRKGNRIGSLGEPVDQLNVRISPDGTKVASEIFDPQVRDLLRHLAVRCRTRSQNTVDIWSWNLTNAMLVTQREAHCFQLRSERTV